MDVHRERELAAFVLGMAIAQRGSLDILKAECAPADFPASLRLLAGGLFREERDLIEEQVKLLWGVRHTEERISSSVLRHFLDGLERRKLVKSAEEFALYARLLDPEAARGMATELARLRAEAMKRERTKTKGEKQ